MIALAVGVVLTAVSGDYHAEARATRAMLDESNSDQLELILSSCKRDISTHGEVQCRRAKYVRGVTDLLTKLRSAPSTPGGATSQVKTSDESAYQVLFENFVLQSIPFKGKLISNFSASTVAALSECMQQAASFSNVDLSSGIPVRKCSVAEDLENKIEVPVVALNSYNVRLASSNGLGEGGENFAMHWPALLPLPRDQDSGSAGTVLSCPSNMHMLLWSPSAVVSARLFHRDTASHGLSPSAGEEHLHRLQFQAPGEEVARRLDALDAVLEAGQGEYLFVPRSHIVSISQREVDAIASHVLQMCFFDASNLNVVRESLALASLTLEPQALGVLATLQGAGNEGFDFSMIRKAPEKFLSMNEHAVYPRQQKQDETAAASPRRGRDRSKGGANGFRDWQDAAKWGTMVRSLTLPQTTPPLISMVGRTNLTVTWSSDYFPAARLRQLQEASAASSPAGFNITVCEAGSVAEGLDGASSLHDGAASGCHVISISSRNLLNLAEQSLTTSLGDVTVNYRTSVHDLQPDTSYVSRSSLYYEGAGGMPSLWSEPVSTLRRTPPTAVAGALLAKKSSKDSTTARLAFARPLDDGGSEILGFHVFMHHTELDYHHAEWTWHSAEHGRYTASRIELDVPHLLPRAIYEFRVKSFNLFGNSSLSDISNQVSTDATATSSGTPSIFGAHHGRRLTGELHSTALMSTSRKWVTVDDEAQVLSVAHDVGVEFNYEVWDCHWSPRMFKVTAEAMWSLPPLADTYSDATASLHIGKIVVTRRGGVPLAVKARHLQRSGAIAVVVLDDERESCVVFNQQCMAGADKRNGERFAVHDHSSAWSNLRIPVLLMKASDTSSFLEATGLPALSEIFTQQNYSPKSDL